MKTRLKQSVGIILIIAIFAVTLEILSWGILRTGLPTPQAPPFKISEWSQLDQFMQNFPERYPQIKSPAQANVALMYEPGIYPLTGEKSGKELFTFPLLTPNLDDYFSLRGKETGQLKFRVRYVTDESGRRKTSFLKGEKYSSQIFLMGCSFTMGEGAEQDLIFSSRLAKKLPKSRVTNFGVAGSSPSKNLQAMTLQKKMFFDGLDRNVPVYVIYTFIDDHFRRVVGTSDNFARNPLSMTEPYYYLNNGELKFGGKFEDHFWKLPWLLEAYGRMNFAKATALELPVIGDSHFELMAKIFAKTKSEIQKEFPFVKDFIVAVYPGNNYYFKNLKKFLHAEGITALDYSQINIHALLNGHHTLLTDGHPSPLAHEFYAEMLLNDLQRIHGQVLK